MTESRLTPPQSDSQVEADARRALGIRDLPAHAADATPDFDVAIVGYGPVGQALAALLARYGHRVCAVERYHEIYRLPRAVHLDHEIMRLLQSLGLADVLAEEMVPVRDYQWFGADGEPLLRFDRQGLAPSGWEASLAFQRSRRVIDSFQ